jgi:multiple sugar transport system permease protein
VPPREARSNEAGCRKRERRGSNPRTTPRRRDRLSPVGWVRGGGLTALVFALPMLVIFTAFSWYPIVRLGVLSFQHTNLIDPPTWVGWRTSLR